LQDSRKPSKTLQGSRNLSLLVQGTGKHWLFHETSLSGILFESHDIVDSGSVQNWENLESVALVFILSFDTSMADPKRFREFKKLAWQGSNTRRQRLTAERFLRVHFCKIELLSPSISDNRANYRATILKSLKEKYHQIGG